MTPFDTIDMGIDDLKAVQSSFKNLREASMNARANIPQDGKGELVKYLFTAERYIEDAITAAHNALNNLK